MIKAINYLSFPGGLENTFPIDEAIKATRDYGFQALELCIGDSGVLHLESTEKDCLHIREMADKANVLLPSICSGLYWDRALGDCDAGKRAQARNDLEKMLQISSWLGAKTLLTIPGAVEVFFLPDRPIYPYEDVLAFATQGLREVLPVSERCGVRIGIENVWNKFLLSPTEMAAFIDSFDSPWIGSYFDVGNVLLYGYPEHWIRILGKRIVGVHFKDFRKSVGTVEGFVDLLEGDVDWPAVSTSLREIGYSGSIAAELIPGYKHHPMTRIKNASNAMDAILSR